MKKTVFTILLVALCVFVIGCNATNRNGSYPNQNKGDDSTVGAVTDNTECAVFSPDQLDKMFRSNDDQAADFLLEQLVAAVQEKDAEKIKRLFAANTVASVDHLDEQISALIEFYEGTMVKRTDSGPAVSESRNKSRRVKEIENSYEIDTTEGSYRLAIKFATADTEDPGNIGIQSIYIIKAEDSDMKFTYWGGNIWNPGVNIE